MAAQRHRDDHAFRPREVWITVSHPLMSEKDSIGDMARLKLLRESIESLGLDVRMVVWRDRDGTVHEPADGAAAPPAAARDGAKRRLQALKSIVPAWLWATGKDLGYLALSWRFRRLLERESRTHGPPSLVIDYGFYLNHAAIRFCRRAGIPVILNVETMTEDSIPEVERSPLRALGRRMDALRLRQADRVWSVSAPLAEAIGSFCGRPAETIDVIPNAARQPGPGSIAADIAPGSTVVCFVGGFAGWYALDRLVEACRRLRSGFPGLHLLLVGDGPEREALVRQLEAAGAGWWTVTGRVATERVPGLIRRADVCTITSHTWWSSPLKLLEYGALDRAVVAPALPSITSMVSQDEVSLFEPGDFDGFESALRELLADEGRRQKLGAALGKRVREEYSMEAMAHRVGESIARVGIPVHGRYSK
jgi:glycosyltransferase involved in cell wall biosynthesis